MRIVVEHGKHGTSYWDGSDGVALSKTALAILKDRYEANWYHRPEPELMTFDSCPKQWGESEEEIQAKVDRHNAGVLKRVSAEQQWYDDMEAIVTGKVDDYPVAVGRRGRVEPKSWWLLMERSDYEYEEVELIVIKEAS